MKTVTLAAIAALLLSGCVADDWVSYEDCVVQSYQLAINAPNDYQREYHLNMANYCLEMAKAYAGNRAALQAAIAGAAVQNLGASPREPAPARNTTFCTLHDDFALCQ